MVDRFLVSEEIVDGGSVEVGVAKSPQFLLPYVYLLTAVSSAPEWTICQQQLCAIAQLYA